MGPVAAPTISSRKAWMEPIHEMLDEVAVKRAPDS